MELECGHCTSFPRSKFDEVMAYADERSQMTGDHVLLVSRKPHRQLLKYVDIKKVEAYWLTETIAEGTIPPQLERLVHLFETRINNHQGLIILEGLEWLFTLHGAERVLGMVRSLNDHLHRKPWSVIILHEELAYESQWLRRFHREAPVYVEKQQEEEEATEVEVEEITIPELEIKPKDIELDLLEDGTPRLSFLTKLPESGFTQALLRRRIMQWRRMALDVSELEPALLMDDSKQAYALYAKVEEKVRRVVELERYMETVHDKLSASQITSMRFRLRQLTGIEEIADELVGVN